KGDEGYFLGYSMSSKAFRIFNKRTKRVEENVHIEFLENKAIEKGSGLNWLFDIDSLTKSMNYVQVVDAGTHSTNFSGTKVDASKDVKKDVSSLRYIVLPNWVHEEHLESTLSQPQDTRNTDTPESSGNSNLTATSTNPPADNLEILTVETLIPTVSSLALTICFIDSQKPSSETRLISKRVTNQEETPSLDNILTLTNQFEDILGVTSNSEESNGVEADVSYMETSIIASPIPTLRINRDHSKSQIISPVDTPIQTRNKSKEDPEYPTRVYKVEKVMYGLHQAPRAWYGTLLKYLLSNGFQRGIIDQTLFIRRQSGDFILVQVYLDDIIFGSSNPQLCREFEALMHEKFQMSAMGELNFFLGLQVLQKEDGIFLSQDKYVGDILKKFGYSDVRSLNTPMDKKNPWGKDGTGKDVDLHLYRSMIGSLMYLTASRPDIMFAVYTYARHQVTPKECHLHAVKRIFRYLKGHPKLGLWYPKDSLFDLVAFLDSDYGGATQDRKSNSGGCQFSGRRLISWQCKKQTIVATSTTEAEYVAAASCCGQVL
nr:putative ribonuclease H-like domain-containing protein [Tanacetum cinerariifolium]